MTLLKRKCLMRFKDRFLDIILRKLDNILNPKFANKYIFSLLFIGASLITYQNILSILVQFKIITEKISLELKLSESSNETLVYIGVFFVVISIILFILERFIHKSDDSVEESLQCNYYLCESYDQLVEISKRDFSNFPIENVLLIENEIMDSLKTIVKAHPYNYRHASEFGTNFSNTKEYIIRHPSSCKTNKYDGNYSYFQRVRVPTLKELKSIMHVDGILKLMLLDKRPSKEISLVGCYEDGGCGDGDVTIREEYIFRKVWCAFLAIKNIDDKPIALLHLNGKFIRNSGFNTLISQKNYDDVIEFPKAPLSANSTVLIPIAILLPPLYALDREEHSSKMTNDWQEQVQIVKHETIKTDNLKDFLTFNSQIIPNTISYKKNGRAYTHNIHSFDLSNMYTIDRGLRCGSCPHLFLQSDHLYYERELLTHCESIVGKDSFIVPSNVNTLFIAEIEDEITEIEIIKINGQQYKSNIILRNSDFIKIPVNSGDIIELIGKYIPNQPVDKNLPQGIKRNELVGSFLKAYHNDNINKTRN